MFFVLRPLRLLIQGLVTSSTPRQISMGLAMGMVVGLVPKGNLIALVLGMILAASRVNLAIAASSAVLFTLIGVFLDPVFDRVGTWLLRMPALQSFWTDLYNMPVMPWTDFNNSVVLGSLTVGLLMMWPVHRLSLPWIAEYSVVVTDYFRKWWITRLLMGAEWSSRISSIQ
ncbi:MAG: TIGR03546 family protein [Planctomyces sp.]|nr:TIGR03546 family protein [Planctomyces sp.]